MVDLIEPRRADGPSSSASGGGSRRPRYMLGAAVLVALALVATGVVIFDHWRNGLHTFAAAGNEVGADRMSIGRTFYAPSVRSPTDTPLTVTLTSAQPDITANTARASIRVLVCTPRPGLTAGPGDAWSLTRWCSAVREFTAGSYRLCSFELAPNCVAIFVAVRAQTSGHVHIDGLRIDYEQGFRRGHQLVGIAVDTTTP